MAIWSSRFDASSARRSCGSVTSSSSRPKVTVSPNTDAVSANVSGVPWWKTPCSRREIRVQAVPELVREREDVAPARRPVQQHVRMVRRHRVRAERAGAFSRAGGRVDPRAVEEALRGVGQLPGERSVRVEHQILGGAPADLRLDVGDGSHAVVVGDAVEAEEPRLQRVPPLRDRVATLHRVDEGLHGCVAGLVGEVAARDPAVEVAEPVVDGLVGEQGVQHERPRAQPRLESGGDGLGGGAPHVAVGCVELAERGFERGRCTVELDGDARHLLFEQALERAAARDLLLVEDDLFGLGEQVRPVAPRRAQVVAGEGEPVVGQEALDLFVAQLGPFQLEEQQLGVDRGAALLDALHARAACGIGRVGREVEARVAARAPDEIEHFRESVHVLGEAGRVQLGDVAARLGERFGARVGRVEQLGEAGVAGIGQQRAEIPDDVGGGEIGVGGGHGADTTQPLRVARAAPPIRSAPRPLDRPGLTACGA